MAQRRPFDVDAVFAVWWPRVCEAGAARLHRSVPRWGDARYMWDLVEPGEADPGRLGWRGNLVMLAVCLVAVSVAALVLWLGWLVGVALVGLF